MVRILLLQSVFPLYLTHFSETNKQESCVRCEAKTLYRVLVERTTNKGIITDLMYPRHIHVLDLTQRIHTPQIISQSWDNP